MSTPFTWDEMRYWTTGEWDVVKERLDDLDKKRTAYCPARQNLFAALDACPYDTCRVAILGQDPYPNPEHATGIAFSIPRQITNFPPTLENVLQEYSNDLHYSKPEKGNLEDWCAQGVLLWNCIPSCLAYKSMSHNWFEWTLLTQEIVEHLSKKGIVFAFLGGIAREYSKGVDDQLNDVIVTSHPSPRGSLNAKNPFVGSRLFSTINDKLNNLGLEPINWRLQ